MAIQPKTAALITAGVAVTAGVAYMIYFDHKRRNDPNLKKKLSKFSRDREEHGSPVFTLWLYNKKH